MRRKTTKKRAGNTTFALFLLGLAYLLFTGTWWPNIMLVVGLPLALRQYLLGRKSDMLGTLFVFVGVWVTAQFDIPWRVLLPVLFTISAIYILFREFLENRVDTEEEYEEDVAVEIEITESEKHD